jgi:hypothetical protein
VETRSIRTCPTSGFISIPGAVLLVALRLDSDGVICRSHGHPNVQRVAMENPRHGDADRCSPVTLPA